MLLSSYGTMGAVRHGDHIAKVRITPDPSSAAAVARRDLAPASAPEVFRPALQAELQERPYAFDIQVHSAPTWSACRWQDTTVEWPEHLSPYVTVARLRLPRQDISGPENLAAMDALSFTPWRVTADHAPLGNIMRARKEVYRHSLLARHKLNDQPRTEPRSADEVLGPPR